MQRLACSIVRPVISIRGTKLFGLFFSCLLEKLNYGILNNNIVWNVSPLLPYANNDGSNINGDYNIYVTEEIHTNGVNNDRFTVSSILNITFIYSDPLEQSKQIFKLIQFCQDPLRPPIAEALEEFQTVANTIISFSNIIIQPVSSQTFDGVDPSGMWITTLNIPVSYMINNTSSQQ